MKRRSLALAAALALCASGVARAAEPLTVAVAANVRYAMDDIARAFAEQSGIAASTVIGSSGKLTAQIKAGAPYHVFVSADMGYPQALFKDGFAAAPPKPYALGLLVLWSASGADISKGLPSLADAGIKKIALPNPALAPYGVAAVAALKKTALYDAVEKKLVYGESIAQANQFIVSGAAQAGFTAKSVVLSPEMAGKGRWVAIDPALYDPIVQGAVVTAYGAANAPAASQQFLDFLFSPRARAIFERYGYRLP